MDLKKKDLEKMCSWLIKTIKPKDLEWLREHRPGIFEGNWDTIPRSSFIFSPRQ